VAVTLSGRCGDGNTRAASLRDYASAPAPPLACSLRQLPLSRVDAEEPEEEGEEEELAGGAA